jgi:DNA polymerase III delta prime subunit
LHEAQNALLKLLEEPNTHSLFYLIIPREDILLPTLRSRLHLVAHEDDESSRVENTVYTSFKKLSYSDRLMQIVERLDAEDQTWIHMLIRGALQDAHASKNAAFMRTILDTESYMHTPGCSKKMLLEHFALTL